MTGKVEALSIKGIREMVDSEELRTRQNANACYTRLVTVSMKTGVLDTSRNI